MNKSMKIIYTIILVLFLLFLGCDQQSEIASPFSNLPTLSSGSALSEPLINQEQYIYPKEEFIDDSEYPPGADSVFVPLNLPPHLNSKLVASEVIDGASGGAVEIFFEYDDVVNDKKYSIYAKVEFSVNAFDGSREIRMELDNEKGIITFYPHMSFNVPAKFKAEYKGFDLSGIDPNSVDFLFQTYGGELEHIEYDKLVVDVESGIIDLDDAYLTHFSRYGFVNRTF